MARIRAAFGVKVGTVTVQVDQGVGQPGDEDGWVHANESQRPGLFAKLSILAPW
jgi:hypothetical protein